MTADAELMLIFGALHLVALTFGGVLFLMLLRSHTVEAWRPPPDEDEDGGGGSDRRRPRGIGPSPGGIPLPDDAAPAGARLRGHERLADAYPRRTRRPDHAPQPGPRVPSGT